MDRRTQSTVVAMLTLEAGQHPHIITRPCREWSEAERWARVLAARGFIPVKINGVKFEVRSNVVSFRAKISNVVPFRSKGPGSES